MRRRETRPQCKCHVHAAVKRKRIRATWRACRAVRALANAKRKHGGPSAEKAILLKTRFACTPSLLPGQLSGRICWRPARETQKKKMFPDSYRPCRGINSIPRSWPRIARPPRVFLKPQGFLKVFEKSAGASGRTPAALTGAVFRRPRVQALPCARLAAVLPGARKGLPRARNWSGNTKAHT